jgi:hypothetical protein
MLISQSRVGAVDPVLVVVIAKERAVLNLTAPPALPITTEFERAVAPPPAIQA